MTKPDSNLEREDVSVSQSQPCETEPQQLRQDFDAERAAALASLLARVEAATGPDWKLDRGLEALAGDDWYVSNDQFTASLDAALALVERCKPGTEYAIKGGPETGDFNPWARAKLTTMAWPAKRAFEGGAFTPALAVCAALLKALIADTASPAHGRSQTEDEQS